MFNLLKKFIIIYSTNIVSKTTIYSNIKLTSKVFVEYIEIFQIANETRVLFKKMTMILKHTKCSLKGKNIH